MTDKTDDKITQLFGVLSTQKASLEKSKKEIDRKWITNGSLQLGSSNPINIQTASQDTLVKVVSSLLVESEFSTKAMAALGLLDNTELKISGYHLNDWLQDCQKRIAMLQITAKKAKIADLEERLSAIVSPEQRRQLELEAITKALTE